MAHSLFMKEAVDWRGKKTASDCLKHLYNSKSMSDVVFTFKTDTAVRLPAHKFVLGMRSAVFETMFYGSMPPDDDVVVLDEDDPEIFRLVLKYIYTDVIELNGKVVLQCLYLASKYCLDGLVQKCSDVLKHSVSTGNVCILYEQAKTYDMADLKKQCFSFILKKSTQVFETDDFLALSFESLKSVLANDCLTGTEQKNFKASIRWAKHQCVKTKVDATSANIRLLLGETIYLIRFPLIPMDVFAQEITTSNILTSEEQVELYQYMATNTRSPNAETGNYHQPSYRQGYDQSEYYMDNEPRKSATKTSKKRFVGKFSTKEREVHILKR